jgi:hypothetical protein
MKKMMLGLLTLCCMATAIFAQTDAERQAIHNSYDLKAIAAQEVRLQSEAAARQQRVTLYLQNTANKTEQRSFDVNGVSYYLYDVRPDGSPIYINTKNRESASVIKADKMYSGGSLGLNIQGQGMTVGVWDGGKVRLTHELFPNGKVTQADAAETLSDHATHVTGTIVGASIVNKPEARGIAFDAIAKAYFWDDDAAEYSKFGTDGYLVSNHSYGRKNTEEAIWTFGAYDEEAKNLDAVLVLRPKYLQCWAIGNEQETNNNRSNKSGYDVVTGTSASKNIMSVGAVDAQGAMTDFSNWGPTDDGRIKPDLVAKGKGVTSSYSTSDTIYDTGDGTSYASPAIAGAAILLQQYYKSLRGEYLDSAALKGIFLHTATDLGPVGPDYQFGWGLANLEKASTVIQSAGKSLTLNNTEAKISTVTTNPAAGSEMSYTFKAKGGVPMSASISWVDDAGPEQLETEGIDPTTSRLVYNFDIKLVDTVTNAEYFPWKGPGMANRTQPATRTGVNDVDNFKRVDIDTPVADRTYKLVITKRASSPSTVRNFTIVWTGLKKEVTTANEQNETVKEFTLSEAYPNPFNPTTRFTLQVAKSQQVTVRVYDMLGREVRTLYNGLLQGDTEKAFSLDASELTSGHYLVRVQGDYFVASKQLVLAK